MEKQARRRHVPAFGEWNYYSSSSPDEPPELPRSGAAVAAAEWWCSPPEPEACSDVWFRYSPPPRKPAPAPRKARTRPEKGSAAAAEAARARRDPGAGAGAGGGAAVEARAAAAKGGSNRRVVRPVDEDLYQVPPPDFAPSYYRPRRRAGRSLWMGCLGGLGCIA